jgi:hypothetical protein
MMTNLQRSLPLRINWGEDLNFSETDANNPNVSIANSTKLFYSKFATPTDLFLLSTEIKLRN